MDEDPPHKPLPLGYGVAPSGRGRIALLLSLLLTLATVLAWSYREITRWQRYQAIREPGDMSRCQGNLKSIGHALLEYASEHDGRFPDSLSQLLLAKNLDGWLFVCPLSRDKVATGATTQEVAGDLNKPGHLSYVYAARGMRTPIDPDAVLLYEPVTNHGFGINFIYGDGRNDFMTAQAAPKLIAELQAGHNPPRVETLNR